MIEGNDMNRVLVTGLGTASAFGICEACHLDFSWLAQNPSILLWADELCIPKSAFEQAVSRNGSKNEKAIKMFLDMAEQKHFINQIDVAGMYQEKVGDEIYEKMLKDSHALLDTFPESITKGEEGVPDEIIIEGEGYCGAWMTSIYTGMRLAKDIGANCIFGNREHTYLKYLYGVDANRVSGSMINKVYNEIFSIYLPEKMAVHNYAFINEENCLDCIHYENCKKHYLEETELALETMFRWRDYDELWQAKEEISKIIKVKNDIISEKDIKDIIKEFKTKQDKINYNINKRFPKIQRWTKMTTVMATPLTIASAVSGNIPLTIGSAAMVGVAEATEQILDIYRSKNNWVGFINDMSKA